ncbi:DNA adenine methylase [Halobacteriovorax sp. RT-1-4]|uniref:DNA adenine methylase n=1 Tax=unclassified Halobacteriovorax TaxID=2639665 RepID=UPI00399C05AB
MIENTTINAERRAALRRDDKYIHIMKYMGSKRELLPDIREEIGKVARSGDGVLDLFAGTGSVGLYLKDKYNIISNDIQNYSSVICDGLITASSIELDFDIESSLVELKKCFKKNKNKLSTMFSETLSISNDFVSIEKKGWKDSERKKYIKFVESFPSPLNKFKGKTEEQNYLYSEYILRERKSKFPYLQTMFLFAETYFSTEQTMDIDSVRYAIDKVFGNNNVERNMALSALIYAHSYCSSGTGHFAMFRDLKDVKSINDVFLYRDKSVWSYFEKKFREIVEFHSFTPERKHLAVSLDFEEVLEDRELSKKYDVIYADPPYSFVHYSRFYHATESLVRYDYMMPKFKGRYRTDRHQSPFCQRLNVEEAFNKLIQSSSDNGKTLVLSYADTGMISLANILKLAEENGMESSVREVDYDHSTMGRAGHKSNKIKEYLVTMCPKLVN